MQYVKFAFVTLLSVKLYIQSSIFKTAAVNHQAFLMTSTVSNYSRDENMNIPYWCLYVTLLLLVFSVPDTSNILEYVKCCQNHLR